MAAVFIPDDKTVVGFDDLVVVSGFQQQCLVEMLGRMITEAKKTIQVFSGVAVDKAMDIFDAVTGEVPPERTLVAAVAVGDGGLAGQEQEHFPPAE